MPSETLQLITQQPMDKSGDPNRYYPFPAIDGLAKPPRPATAPVRRIGLHLVDGQERRQSSGGATISASPFHGVTRLAILVDGFVSQDFNNGKGDVDTSGQVLPQGKRGRYFDEVDAILAVDFAVDLPRICWKVRHPDGFRTVQFDLFTQGRSAPIWSLRWDEAQVAANIGQGALTAGFKEKDGEFAPLVWTGSMDWEQTIRITDPAFPGGLLTAEQSPYQLRMTVNDNDPGPARMGYPLIAWTYFAVIESAADEATQPTGWLAVQVRYEGMVLADLPVQFYTLTADNRQGQPIGEPQLTNDEGIALLVEPVAWGRYGCLIEQQPLAIICPVTDAATPFGLTLPIGEAQLERFAPIGDLLDEEEELADEETPLDMADWDALDEEEAEDEPADETLSAAQQADEEAQGWL
nr:hypothetical protein [Anaerolinea sp.]